MLDLRAPIVPGHSAAGFVIGQSIQELSDELRSARHLTHYPGFDLVGTLNRNTEILRIDGFGHDGGTQIYFGPDTVRLTFSKAGLLCCIYLFDGYLGTYRETQLGASLSSVSEHETLLYDDGDEMYYRVDAEGEYIPGFAICASDATHEEHSATVIYGFCVHDWTLAKNAV